MKEVINDVVSYVTFKTRHSFDGCNTITVNPVDYKLKIDNPNLLNCSAY